MRLRSLDVLRGLIVTGMMVVNSAIDEMWGKDGGLSLMQHSRREGLKPANLVFPAFLTMVGVAILCALGTVPGG